MSTILTRPGVLAMAGPLVVSFWMRAAVTFVDTVYAAFAGDAAVAAIGLVVPVEFLMIALWVGLSTGLTSSLARAMGDGTSGTVECYVRAAWRLVAVCGPLFAIVGAAIWYTAPHLGLDAEVARGLQVYGTVLIVGSAFTTFWSIIPDSLVKAHQDTRSTMWAGIWSNVINVGLNTWFVFGLEWGLFGIALSTVIGRLGGLAYALHRAAVHERARKARERADAAPTPTVRPYREMLGLAVPASATFVLMAMESGLINGLLATLDDATAAIAAYSIYFRVAIFALQPVIATSVAMLPFAARRFGEGDVAGVITALRQAGVAVGLYSVVLLGPALYFGAPALSSWLAESEVTAGYSTFALRLVPLACLLGGPFLLCRPIFEAMQRGRPGLWMAVLRYVVLTGPFAWLGITLAARYGYQQLDGLLVGLLASTAISSAIFRAWAQAALRQRSAAHRPA